MYSCLQCMLMVFLEMLDSSGVGCMVVLLLVH